MVAVGEWSVILALNGASCQSAGSRDEAARDKTNDSLRQTPVVAEVGGVE